MSVPIGEPTAQEIEQSETPEFLRTVPVKVETPVRVQELPGAVGTHFAVTFPDTSTVQPVLKADHRRKRIVVVAKTDTIWIGTSQQATAGKQCFPLPTGVPVEITHKEAIFALPDAQATAILGVIQEQWTN